MTPHINAKPGDFAETCLMPGDPLRARHIAENFFEEVRQVTDVRNMLGFTGTYQGLRVSVMGSGMGIPSASIYYKELITEYHVKNLIRVGSCGAISKEVQVRDIVIGMGACTDSKVNRMRFKDHDFAAIADYGLLERAANSARNLKLPVKVGNLFSADLFYNPDASMFDIMEKHGILGVEMEAAGLYGACAEFDAKGLAICTVSDHIRTGEALPPEDRQSTFNEMIEVALQSLL